ncbi:DsbE family thiol:disulfide interchange protein [Phreatobacter sp. AB_2022a]|uniref:DsbE family thiol:disulfide interchange protein n=1 Tax=Phreatobacter sp. AB_2022a TaxID=3003134 RepID=UPI002286F27C|nr:DsbE family thiol:disulfide interchange protein [Phreatobacter sp. AB_2022a]MCZ0737201.1 DsbE family thiol:disulfide interchange protein [Phreatobacter sp. AB_2022a]
MSNLAVPAAPRRRWLAFVPLAVFIALAALFLIGLQGDPQKLPSALIGKPVPDFSLSALEGIDRPGLATADLSGAVTVVNVFASWCIPCHEEHPQLVELARDSRIRMAGINQKDQPENARRFLERNGNPYQRIGVDPNGRAAIEWGVYGVPETFIVGRDGRILYKHVGPITPQILTARIKPQIEAALAAR